MTQPEYAHWFHVRLDVCLVVLLFQSPTLFLILILILLPRASNLTSGSIRFLDKWTTKGREEKWPTWVPCNWGSSGTRAHLPLLQSLPLTSTSPTVSLWGHHCWTRGSLCLPVSRPGLCSMGKLLNHKPPFSISKMERAEKKLRDTWGVVKSGMCNKNESREAQGHPIARAKRVIKCFWPHVAHGHFHK